MKTTRILLLLAALAAIFVPGVRAAAAVGAPAPEFTLTDLDGRPQALSAYRGRIVVLEWVNPECPFVRKHYESGNLPRLQKAATADGVVWLSVNSARDGAQGDYDRAAVAAWAQATGAAPTAYLRDRDGAVGRLYGARTTPHLFVIDAAGTLAYAGAIDSIRSADAADIAEATNYVTAALDALKSGRPVAKPSTQPYGCPVKY